MQLIHLSNLTIKGEVSVTTEKDRVISMLREKITNLEDEQRSKVEEIEALRIELEKYKKLAMFNSTTGLYNLNFVKAEFRRIKAAKEREFSKFPEFLGLAFIDIDGLKGINDTHGHFIGNKVLIHAGNALLETVRKSDLVAHLHGDEFITLTIVRNRKEARNFSKRIRETMKSLRLKITETITITFSATVGCKFINLSKLTSFEDFERLNQSADLNMYTRKKERDSQS